MIDTIIYVDNIYNNNNNNNNSYCTPTHNSSNVCWCAARVVVLFTHIILGKKRLEAPFYLPHTHPHTHTHCSHTHTHTPTSHFIFDAF